MQRSKGFTLLEVLISVALVSVIMLLIWQTTFQSIKGKERAEKRQNVYHMARVALDKMSMDLTQAFLLNGAPHLGVRQGSPQLKTLFQGTADTLQFTSLSHRRLFSDARESDSTEISYRLEANPEDRDVSLLMRREARRIDSNPEEGGRNFVLAEKIKKLEFGYYDGQKLDWQSSWNTESGEAGKLPRAVKVKLTLAHPTREDETIEFMTTVLLEMHKNAIDF